MGKEHKKRTPAERQKRAEQEKARRQRKKEEEALDAAILEFEQQLEEEEAALDAAILEVEQQLEKEEERLQEEKLAKQRQQQRQRQANYIARKKAKAAAKASMATPHNNNNGDEPPTPVHTTEQSRAAQMGSVADGPQRRAIPSRGTPGRAAGSRPHRTPGRTTPQRRAIPSRGTPGRASGSRPHRTPGRMTPQQAVQLMRFREERAERMLGSARLDNERLASTVAREVAQEVANVNLEGARAVMQDLNADEEVLLGAAFGQDTHSNSDELLHATGATASEDSSFDPEEDTLHSVKRAFVDEEGDTAVMEDAMENGTDSPVDTTMEDGANDDTTEDGADDDTMEDGNRGTSKEATETLASNTPDKASVRDSVGNTPDSEKKQPPRANLQNEWNPFNPMLEGYRFGSGTEDLWGGSFFGGGVAASGPAVAAAASGGGFCFPFGGGVAASGPAVAAVASGGGFCFPGGPAMKQPRAGGSPTKKPARAGGSPTKKPARADASHGSPTKKPARADASHGSPTKKPARAVVKKKKSVKPPRPTPTRRSQRIKERTQTQQGDESPDTRYRREHDDLFEVMEQLGADYEDEQDVPEPDPWVCSFCGHQNPHEQAFCSMEKTKPELHKPPMVWTGAFAKMEKKKNCPVCTQANDLAATVCIACEKPF